MKLTLLAFILAIGSFANAASVERCHEEVRKQCNNAGTLLNFKVTSEASECKMIQADGGNFRVAFISRTGDALLSVTTTDCSYSYYKFESGTIISGDKSNKVIDGRLFSLLSSNRVVALGLNNSIYELNNSKNKPYSTVTGLNVVDGVLVMEQNAGGDIELSMDQLDKRIEGGKISVLDTSVRFY